jgi:purine-binding chemotaxis protein CheW
MEKDLQIVGLKINGETFGIPISHVREIVRVPQITMVPHAPEIVEGVMNLRGRIVPIVDLRKRFGEKDIQPNKRNRIVIIEMDERLVGLTVNAASEVLKIPPAQVEPPQTIFPDNSADYVSGIAKLNERLVILIDLHKILRPSELRRVERVAEMAGALSSQSV